MGRNHKWMIMDTYYSEFLQHHVCRPGSDTHHHNGHPVLTHMISKGLSAGSTFLLSRSSYAGSAVISHVSEHIIPKENKTIDYEIDISDGKCYVGGLTRTYNGNVVDCLTYATKSGRISKKILVKIFEYFDKIHLFPRLPCGCIPILNINGHQSG